MSHFGTLRSFNTQMNDLADRLHSPTLLWSSGRQTSFRSKGPISDLPSTDAYPKAPSTALKEGFSSFASLPGSSGIRLVAKHMHRSPRV